MAKYTKDNGRYTTTKTLTAVKGRTIVETEHSDTGKGATYQERETPEQYGARLAANGFTKADD